jgi:signal peptidase I
MQHIEKLLPAITGVLLAALVAYLASWWLQMHEGNFAAALMLATVVSGIYWLAERFYFLPRRAQAAQALEAQDAALRAKLDAQGVKTDISKLAENQAAVLAQPWWLDWTAGLFPVLAVVFVLRSFIYEPFKIPSGSMIPTLWIGDLILVDKFTYGIRVPVFHQQLTTGNRPQRGDVVVFRHPPQPTRDYIKRVIGVPGDEVSYLNKQLSINGKPVAATALPEFLDPDTQSYNKHFEESLDDRKHRILVREGAPASVFRSYDDFPFRNNCRYSVEGVVCKVPDGHYFMMGDNRDNSEDSRFWGFVPQSHLVGRAKWVWMNFSHFGRIGTKIE